jgi:transcriptional regulator with XRE-family HTH domain
MDIAELRHTFSTRIRGLREGKMNQGEFADSVGVSRGAMSYYEQEMRTPDIGVLRAICEKYSVSADYLLGLIPDTNHAVSDVCRETGLIPKVAKRLSIFQWLKKIEISPDSNFTEQIVAQAMIDFGDNDALIQEVVDLLPHTSAPTMVNVLIANNEGLAVLNLLGAILMGAKLHTNSDTTPYFKLPTNHGNLEVTYEMSDLTAALWINVQKEFQAIKDKVDEFKAK